jgi:ubiquinone/menaquinone biosynthesis C-methylase UbiE
VSERTFLPALRFRALTPYFDAVVRVSSREQEFKRRLLERIDLAPGAAIVDVGAGTGTLAIELSRRWPEARVTGLDADPEILAIARRKAARAGAELDLVEGFSTALPFEDASFDAVVSTLFFHHLADNAKEETLAELRRVLTPGGVLHVADWGSPLDPLQRAAFLTVRAFDGFDVTAANARGALPVLFAAAGFARVEVQDRMRTALGTLELLRAENPAG